MTNRNALFGCFFLIYIMKQNICYHGTEFTNEECSKVFDAKHGEYLYSFNIDDELQKKLLF